VDTLADQDVLGVTDTSNNEEGLPRTFIIALICCFIGSILIGISILLLRNRKLFGYKKAANH